MTASSINYRFLSCLPAKSTKTPLQKRPGQPKNKWFHSKTYAFSIGQYPDPAHDSSAYGWLSGVTDHARVEFNNKTAQPHPPLPLLSIPRSVIKALRRMQAADCVRTTQWCCTSTSTSNPIHPIASRSYVSSPVPVSKVHPISRQMNVMANGRLYSHLPLNSFDFPSRLAAPSIRKLELPMYQLLTPQLHIPLLTGVNLRKPPTLVSTMFPPTNARPPWMQSQASSCGDTVVPELTIPTKTASSKSLLRLPMPFSSWPQCSIYA